MGDLGVITARAVPAFHEVFLCRCVGHDTEKRPECQQQRQDLEPERAYPQGTLIMAGASFLPALDPPKCLRGRLLRRVGKD